MSLNQAETMLMTRNDLIQYFIQGEKPAKDHKVGLEYELFGMVGNKGKPLPFDGVPGVEDSLQTLAQFDQWDSGFEEGRLLSLHKNGRSLFLEPGGQFELSTSPYASLIDLDQEIQQTLQAFIQANQSKGIYLTALGLQPFTSLDEVGWIPKKRYKIMSQYFAEAGGALAHQMMKQTASIQINVDYSSEKEAMLKFRFLTAISPIVTALFANSAIYEGKVLPYQSYRSHIWQQTDSERCGLIKNVFNPNYSYEEYLDFILEIPMMFIKRGDEWLDVEGLNFAQFLEKGYQEEEATLDDWKLHLSTVFTEVRLKQVLELRSADSHLPDKAMAVAALTKGLISNPNILESAWDLVKNWTWEERLKLYEDVATIGLRAQVKNDKIRVIANELAKLCVKGLSEEEQRFVDPIFEILEKGKTLAEESVIAFQKDSLKWLQSQRLGHENGI